MDKKYKKYFDANPDVDVFYFTTDGQAFRKKDAAERHQKTLTKKVKDVKPVKRSDAKDKSKDKEVKNLESELKTKSEEKDKTVKNYEAAIQEKAAAKEKAKSDKEAGALSKEIESLENELKELIAEKDKEIQELTDKLEKLR